MNAVNGLAAMLITAIVGMAVTDSADGRPPRATLAGSFTAIAAVVGMVGIFSALGLLLR